MSNEENPGGISPVQWDIIVVIVALAIAVGGTFALHRFGAGEWADDPFLSLVGWVGAIVSLIGVLLAYLIFRRQTRQSRTAEQASAGLMRRLHDLVLRVDRKIDGMVVKASDQVSDDEADVGGDEPDQWEDEIPEPGVATDEPIIRTANIELNLSASGHTLTSSSSGSDGANDHVYLESSNGKRRIYDRLEIPLSVIGALVGQWREQGRSGRWDIGALVGGFRSVGKGNHPWFLVFRVPGSEKVEMWKVTRGPNDTDRATQIATPDSF